MLSRRLVSRRGFRTRTRAPRQTCTVFVAKHHDQNCKQTHEEQFHFEKDFGKNVFSPAIMESYVPPEVVKQYKECLKKKKPVSMDVADVIAHGLKEWAISRGATHFTHWFQPLTGLTAEKHDSFVKPTGNVAAITQFKGKQLVGGEPDASSFPSGGLRETHEARGYTVWDPQTPAFINEEGGVPVLCIPCCFYSWKGHALDRKIPLLRSQVAVERSGKRLFSVIGEKGHDTFWSDSGVEQEFFLIDSDQWDKRPDVRVTGRTLQGASASKDQELSDHYFGALPSRALQCIDAIEKAAWKLGIPIATRHQEVAPNQFEVAPVFDKSSVASDYNMILMELMLRIAPKFGLNALLHEKPFAGVNGSGKHNNWSIGTNLIPTLMDPGSDPINNKLFLLTLAAVIRGVDMYQDLMRYGISGAGNDHRLGGHEAPPAIFSVYLGDFIYNAVKSVMDGTSPPKPVDRHVDLGVPYLPNHPRDPTDRNRTSPFAFTGNKFEVRCVGSSQRPAISNMLLNTISADSFEYLADELEKLIAKGKPVDDAINQVVKDTLGKHKRIIYEGNNYSHEWVEEAEKRGVKNYKTTPEVLDVVYNDKNIQLLERHKVMTREEFHANVVVDYETYNKVAHLEAQSLRRLADRWIVPATIKYQKDLLSLGELAPQTRVRQLSNLVAAAVQASDELGVLAKQLTDTEDPKQGAQVALKKIIPKAAQLRSSLDDLELLVDQSYWPLPTYEEILHEKAR